MPRAENLVQVQVLVPRDRVAEFYERHAQWLQSVGGPSAGASRPQKRAARADTSEDVPNDTLGRWQVSDFGTRPSGPSEIEGLTDANPIFEFPPELPQPWTIRGDNEGGLLGDHLAAAINIYQKLSPKARTFFDVLLDQPGTMVSGDRLEEMLGVSQSQLTGTLASVTIRSKAVRRELPFRYRSGSGGGGRYWVDNDVADLFIWAREQPPEVVDLAKQYDEYVQLFRKLSERRFQMLSEEDLPGYEVTSKDMEFKFMHALMEISLRLARTYQRAKGLRLSEADEWLLTGRRLVDQRLLDLPEEVPMT